MEELDVFLSIGGTATDKQEAFVRAVEDRLRSEGLVPHTVGRNTFSSDAPLKTVTELMDKCVGTVVIALERMYFPAGVDKRGGDKETPLSEVKLPTPWNQIEAAMAYVHQHPLMVIVEEGLKSEGLLERGYNWYVQLVKPEASSLNTLEFNGVLASWKSKIAQSASAKKEAKTQSTKINPVDLTIGELVKGLKPAQLWAVLIALAGLVAGAFALGAKLIGGP
jgi:hypothetical protein